MASARWVGRGDKNGADAAAVNAMRLLIGSVSMNGVVVIGEGEKDDAPMLFNGEHVGDGTGPEGQVTNSIVMRGKSGTIRDIRSEHRIDKLADYATVGVHGGMS